jgi:hypothetical protein
LPRVFAKSGDRGEQPAPVADRRDAEAAQVVRRQLRQDIAVNVVLGKRGGVLLKA